MRNTFKKLSIAKPKSKQWAADFKDAHQAMREETERTAAVIQAILKRPVKSLTHTVDLAIVSLVYDRSLETVMLVQQQNEAHQAQVLISQFLMNLAGIPEQACG